MAVDTPAKIAILGAGPIGLEAALYARFLGYEVALYERGEAAEHLRQTAHVRWFTPFKQNSSSLGRAALAAQGGVVLPSDDALLTAGELVDAYFRPLAESDLLVDGLHEQTEVLASGRGELLKGELVGDDARREFPFRVLLRSAEGERVEEADVVIDATGVWGRPNSLGAGGIPAVGEAALAARCEHGLPDVLGARRNDFARGHTLVIGAGHSAATNVVALAELAEREPGTQVTWLVRREGEACASFPVERLPDDPVPARRALAERANTLAASGAVQFLAGRSVLALGETAAGRVAVTLSGAPVETLEVDRVLASVGHRPNRRLSAELHVPEPAGDSATLLLPEPDFYVLGAKSLGNRGQFLLSQGHAQVRQLFSILGDRADLDLYRTIGRTKL
ncbi:MAG: FAD-dependent oxidoreductase [Pirellulales bacterium]